MFVPSSNPHHPHHQNHYSLKLKSMFELALASGSPQQPQQHQHHLLQQQLLTSSSLVAPAVNTPFAHLPANPLTTQYTLKGVKLLHNNTNNNNNNNNTIVESSFMDGLPGAGGVPLGYPISPQSANSGIEEEDGSRSPGMEQQQGHHRGQQHSINFLNQAHHPQQHCPSTNQLSQNAGLIMSIVPSGSGNRTGEGVGGIGSGGKKQGPGSGVTKPSFSIESLLAHSNSWRGRPQNPVEGCTAAIPVTPVAIQQLPLSGRSLKDGRFTPYPGQSPQTQGSRGGCKSGGTTCSGVASQGVTATSTLAEGGEKQQRSRENCEASGGKGAAGPTGTGGGNGGRRAAKSKRVRTIFTPEQLERLEAEFERQQYMVGPERLYLASSLYLTEAQVKVWFQNRRIKWRKQHLEMEQQRLAIYRTLAEQDMLAGAASGVSTGEALTLDDDEDTSSSREDTEMDDSSPVDEDSSQDQDYSDETTNIGDEAPKSCQTPQPPKSNFGTETSPFYHLPSHASRHRVPLQHHSFNLNNDEFLDDLAPHAAAASYTTTATRPPSPSSPTAVFSLRRNTDSGITPSSSTPSHSSLLSGRGGPVTVNK